VPYNEPAGVKSAPNLSSQQCRPISTVSLIRARLDVHGRFALVSDVQELLMGTAFSTELNGDASLLSTVHAACGCAPGDGPKDVLEVCALSRAFNGSACVHECVRARVRACERLRGSGWALRDRRWMQA